MNEETKLILENQVYIMQGIFDSSEKVIPGYLVKQIKKTAELLNPKEEQSLADKTKKALEKKEWMIYTVLIVMKT